MGAGQRRRITGAGDDDIADPGEVVGTAPFQQPGRDGVVAAAHVRPPSQQLAQVAITSDAAPGSVCR